LATLGGRLEGQITSIEAEMKEEAAKEKGPSPRKGLQQ